MYNGYNHCNRYYPSSAIGLVNSGLSVVDCFSEYILILFNNIYHLYKIFLYMKLGYQFIIIVMYNVILLITKSLQYY